MITNCSFHLSVIYIQQEQLANGKQSESQLEERLRVSQSEVAELRELLEDARYVTDRLQVVRKTAYCIVSRIPCHDHQQGSSTTS